MTHPEQCMETAPHHHYTDPSGVQWTHPALAHECALPDCHVPPTAEQMHAAATEQMRSQLIANGAVDDSLADRLTIDPTHGPADDGESVATTSLIEDPPQTAVLYDEDDQELLQLHAEYWAAKEQEKAAEARAKTATDALKARLSEVADQTGRAELFGPGGRPLALTYVESWRLDTKALKAKDPETYVRYATKSGSWRLAEIKPEVEE